jgi:hypothetical protein
LCENSFTCSPQLLQSFLTLMMALNNSLALIYLLAAACCFTTNAFDANAPGLAQLQRHLQAATDPTGVDTCKTQVS